MQYDSERKHPDMMEHVRTFPAYVEELRKSLVRLTGAADRMHLKLLRLSASSPSCEGCGIDVATCLSVCRCVGHAGKYCGLPGGWSVDNRALWADAEPETSLERAL